LAKTNLVLNINLANNYHEVDYDALPNWEYIFLDAKTFEEEINTREDCYTVLEKILGFHCYIQQHNNEWWIMNYDEYVNGVFYYWKFDDQGDYVSAHTAGTTLKDDIEHNVLQTITDGVNFFSQEDQEVKLTRPHKSIALDYILDLPIELIENQQFTRGTLTSTTVIGTDTHNQYTVEDWTTLRGDPEAPMTNLSVPYIKKVISEQGVTTENYVVIPCPVSASTDTTYIQCQRVPLNEKDKFNLSVDWRLSAGISSGTEDYVIFSCRLYGESGQKYQLLWARYSLFTEDVLTWVPIIGGVVDVGSGAGYFTEINFSMIDEEDWQSLTWEAPPLPESGEITIELHSWNTSVFPFDNVDVHFTNLRFDYKPFLNNCYIDYKSIRHKVTQAGNYKAALSEQVYVSDAPRKLFKGAMFKYDGSNYVLTEDWHNGWIYHGLPPAYEMPFGRLQALAVWNQYFREFRIISGSVQGIFNRPDSIPIWQMLMPSSYTGSQRYFFLMNFEIDVKMCEWKGTFAEFYDSSDDVSYTGEGKALDLDDMEVKYIS
jgi:hypothetical protein